MSPLPSLLSLAHLVGLVLGVGAASVKVVLLLKCRAEKIAVASYLDVVRPITRLIILGLVLMTLSGLGWLAIGYDLSSRLVLKLVMVGVVWVLGPVIDKLVEPRFRAAAPAAGSPLTPEFERARGRYLSLELLATGLFYAIILVWSLR